DRPRHHLIRLQHCPGRADGQHRRQRDLELSFTSPHRNGAKERTAAGASTADLGEAAGRPVRVERIILDVAAWVNRTAVGAVAKDLSRSLRLRALGWGRRPRRSRKSRIIAWARAETRPLDRRAVFAVLALGPRATAAAILVIALDRVLGPGAAL